MSIHKSKGLEFPIVFVSCLGRKFNTQSQRNKFVMHRDFGLGMECVYRDAAIRIGSANMLAIKRKIAFEAASEELRVLYVALTRPTEKLILTAAVSKGAQLLANAEKVSLQPDVRLNPYMIYSASDFIQLILYAAVRSEGYPREFSANDACIIRDGCKYHLTLKNISQICPQSQIKCETDWHSQYDGPTDNYSNIKSILGYSYPYVSSVNAPTNMTVTELKRMALESDGAYELFDDVQLANPSEFVGGRKIAGASLGTLIHLVMEKLDFSRVSDENMINEQLLKLCADSVITDDELSSIDVSKLYSFFTSPLGKRMTDNAHTLQREYSFKYLANANEIFSASSDDQLVIQGTIDAFFIDADGSVVIVDYKTDKVIDGNTAIIAERYHTQLDYYAKALEITLQRPVKEKLLYLFDTGEAINV